MTQEKLCTRCIMDTTIRDIRFDENGVCNFCALHDSLEKIYPLDRGRIDEVVSDIKKKGSGKKYDCVVGLSGGTDSTYCLYLCKEWGLRPLAVHLDNGWNTDTSIDNIQNAVEKLDVDLQTITVHQKEFRELQIAFLKASVPDAEIPTDIGIYSTLFGAAAEKKIRYVVNGHSFRAEGTAPIFWTYMDGKYIDSVYKTFYPGKKLIHFPNLRIPDLINFTLIRRIKEFRPLEYLDYDKVETRKILEKELNWKYYGGLHYESLYTRFIHSYLFINKFNIDYRKVSLSARIRSGKMTREEGLASLLEPPYPEEKIREDIDIILQKLGLSKQEFQEIIESPPRTFLEYPTYYRTIRRFGFVIRIACKLGLLPEILYEKYGKPSGDIE